MAFLDGTGIRAHQKAAGAARKGGRRRSATTARRSAARAAATARRRSGSPTAAGVRWPSPSRRGRRTNCRWRPVCWTGCRRRRSGSSATAASPRTLSASACRGHGRASRHPAQAQRGAGRLPGVDLWEPPPRREPVGAAEGVARRRHPLREDRPRLPRRALPRRPWTGSSLAGPSGARQTDGTHVHARGGSGDGGSGGTHPSDFIH